MKLVKKRILQIVNQHTAGVFMHQLPVYYNKQYGEALPENWQTIVKESEEINQEKGAGDWTILCQCSLTSKVIYTLQFIRLYVRYLRGNQMYFS